MRNSFSASGRFARRVVTFFVTGLSSVARAHDDVADHADLVICQPPEYLHVLSHSFLFVGLAVALIALVSHGKRAKARGHPTAGRFLLASSNIPTGAWIGTAAGRVRNPEFRPSGVETPHLESKHSH